MSWLGLGKKQDFVPIFADEWNTIIDALDELYNMLMGIKQGTDDIYVRALHVAGTAYVDGYLYIQGKLVDPPNSEMLTDGGLFISKNLVRELDDLYLPDDD